MHKGKEKKKPPQLAGFVPDTWGFFSLLPNSGMEERGKWLVLSSLTDLNLISGIIVCASITAVHRPLMTSSEITLKQSCPWKGHQLFCIHITQLQQCRKAEVSEQNSLFCSVFSPTDLPSMVAGTSASGHM